MASEGSKSGAAGGSDQARRTCRQERQERARGTSRSGPTTAPCCGSRPTSWCAWPRGSGPTCGHPAPAWPDIVDAADWLRHDLGVSKSALGRRLPRHGPRKGRDCARDRLGQAGRALHRVARRAISTAWSQGQGRRAQSGAHALGVAETAGQPGAGPRPEAGRMNS